MAAIKQLKGAVEKVRDAGKVANRLWDTGFIDVMTLSDDGRFVSCVTLHNGATSTIKFDRMDRTTGRTVESTMEVVTSAQASKLRKMLEEIFWPETSR